VKINVNLCCKTIRNILPTETLLNSSSLQTVCSIIPMRGVEANYEEPRVVVRLGVMIWEREFLGDTVYLLAALRMAASWAASVLMKLFTLSSFQDWLPIKSRGAAFLKPILTGCCAGRGGLPHMIF
jgi:hypothetical protein